MQSTQSPITERSAHAGLLLSAAIVGLSFPAVGLIGEQLPPRFLTALRFAFAALAVWPLVRGRPGLRPDAGGLFMYALMGASLAAFFTTMFWAAREASAVSMAAIYVSVPVIAYSLGRLFGVENRSPRMLAILDMGAMGALLLVWADARGTGAQFTFGRAEAMFLLACVGVALYPVLSKLGLKYRCISPRAEVRTFWSLVTGAVGIAVVAMFTESPQDLLLANGRDLAVVLYLAVFSSALTFWLSQRATAVLTPGALTAYSYTAPFIAMLLLFLSEPGQVGWRWLPGSLLVVAAIVLLLRGEAPRSTSESNAPRIAVPGTARVGGNH